MKTLIIGLSLASFVASFTTLAQTLKVATFNVSMESTNYTSLGMAPSDKVLAQVLSSKDNLQVRNIAEIIQRVNPDILLLNEFDYIADKSKGIDAFVKHFLNVPQAGQGAVDYPYTYVAAVNTGVPTEFDLDNNGKAEKFGGDAYGYGLYPGQYGMAILSKYPIEYEQIRTFQMFKWHHMPNAQIPVLPAEDGSMENGEPWYSEEEWTSLRLSSKSHWDVPVKVNGSLVHVLAMHPTPPNFDGEEDRNGKRNHDEIRLMADYLTPGKGSYIYDDAGHKASLPKNTRFVLVGDFNAADIGDKHRPDVIEQLTESPYVNNRLIPTSEGGAALSEQDYSRRFTAYWGARADYVLPSTYGFNVQDAGVFWPPSDSPLYRLVKDRNASSDHRMVWVTLEVLESEDHNE
ncbi:MAG TPA: endonuclease/exonuclease/phosphatase family protein [Alteromonas australica]|uniref:Endonuclease/exonuclease/phosphatase family protein n=2 Tax=Alteromonas australica TaxID=589873 RepID=A0A358DZ96_9ALTE|nr:endonuclease/exonuclease/phosphatase family protein [Alteromonas australica]HAI71638.1 endonuclease/exonuclease/phosphatase family protein [Alteromonas australica]HAU26294.1 endonuclease/exonuclease/phosphatase family protein [Alteromonas australica]HBU51586.1 endonuclease/exonuclease/phosphatase family protein [Alteromonas australica]|tara:strand:- start:3039 stop:4247 length:1209 start_codon:yes stop_codon:yes gene_type:complete